MHRVLIPALVFLSSFVSHVFAQGEIRWETGLEAAFARSKSENKPLLITMHMSKEIACQRMLRNIYTDPEVIAKLQNFVLLPTCVDRHKEVTRIIDGTSVNVSALFGSISCDALRKNEKEVRFDFLETTDVKVPNHIFVDHEQKIFMQKIYELKKPAFLELLNRALVQFGAKVVDGMDGATKKLYKAVRKGSTKQKVKAVKAILDFQDKKKTDTLYMIIEGLKKETDKAACIRAMGNDGLEHAIPIVLKWLNDPSVLVKNCAVVTLEELKAEEATKPLLALFKVKKSNYKVLHTDILRALGPCGAGEQEVKTLLLAHVSDKREPMRMAAYMSLGYFLEDEDVQETLQDRWKKDAKGVAPRTAILFAYMTSKDSSLIPQVDALIKGERNHQIILVAEAAKREMGGKKVKAKKGSAKSLRKALSPLYTKDKIIRNRIKRWRR